MPQGTFTSPGKHRVFIEEAMFGYREDKLGLVESRKIHSRSGQGGVKGGDNFQGRTVWGTVKVLERINGMMPPLPEKFLDSPRRGVFQRFICQIFSRKEIVDWITKNDAELVEQEYYRFFSGEFWTFGEWIYPPFRVSRDQKHQLTCILLQKRI